MNRDTYEMLARLERAGIAPDDAIALRRISMTLHRWHELECGDGNGYIERDDATGKPRYINCNARYLGANDARRGYPIADREADALRRLNAIMARHPELAAYVQGDPRGAALYIYRKDSPMLASSKYGIDSCYSSVGIAVYK